MKQIQGEQWFRDFFEKNTSVMLLILPETGAILDANSSAVRFYGYAKETLIGMNINQINLLSPEMISQELLLAAAEKRNYFNFRHRLASGENKNVEVYSTPIEYGSGKILFSIIHDITERVNAEEKVKSLLEEKEILLKEVHHRIKNNLGVIHSLLDLQIGSLRDPSAISALTDAANRVHSMALLYDKLYQSQDYDQISLSDYIPSLVDDIIANFPNKNLIQAQTNIESANMENKRIQYLGIIINEIITNIMKYAFPPGRLGKVEVKGTTDQELLCLEISDNGIGMPEEVDFDKPTGFGLTLIRFLSKQLDATIQIERDHGTKISLTLPIKKP
jgi:PAS domain S-box-containing protein